MATPKLMAELERLKKDESSFPELCSEEALQFFVDNDDGWYKMRAQQEQTIRRSGRALVAVPKEDKDGNVIHHEKTGKPLLNFVYTIGNNRSAVPDVLAFYPSSTAGFAVNKFCDAFKEGKVPVPDMDKGEVLKVKGMFEDESLEIVYYWIVGNQRKVAAEKYACQLNDDDPLLMLMIPTPDGRHHIEFVPDEMLDTSGAPTEESNFGKKISADDFLNQFKAQLDNDLKNGGINRLFKNICEYMLGWAQFHAAMYSNKEKPESCNEEVVLCCEKVNEIAKRWVGLFDVEIDLDKGPMFFTNTWKYIMDNVDGDNSGMGRATTYGVVVCAVCAQALAQSLVESDVGRDEDRELVEECKKVIKLAEWMFVLATDSPLFEGKKQESEEVVEPSDESPEKLEDERQCHELMHLLMDTEGPVSANAIAIIYAMPGLLIQQLKENNFPASKVDWSQESSQSAVQLIEALAERSPDWAQILGCSDEQVKSSSVMDRFRNYLVENNDYYRLVGLFGFICLNAIAADFNDRMQQCEKQKNFGLANNLMEMREELQAAGKCLKIAYANLIGTTLFINA